MQTEYTHSRVTWSNILPGRWVLGKATLRSELKLTTYAYHSPSSVVPSYESNRSAIEAIIVESRVLNGLYVFASMLSVVAVVASPVDEYSITLHTKCMRRKPQTSNHASSDTPLPWERSEHSQRILILARNMRIQKSKELGQECLQRDPRWICGLRAKGPLRRREVEDDT